VPSRRSPIKDVGNIPSRADRTDIIALELSNANLPAAASLKVDKPKRRISNPPPQPR
jgi:hypothetical protein